MTKEITVKLSDYEHLLLEEFLYRVVSYNAYRVENTPANLSELVKLFIDEKLNRIEQDSTEEFLEDIRSTV